MLLEAITLQGSGNPRRIARLKLNSSNYSTTIHQTNSSRRCLLEGLVGAFPQAPRTSTTRHRILILLPAILLIVGCPGIEVGCEQVRPMCQGGGMAHAAHRSIANSNNNTRCSRGMAAWVTKQLAVASTREAPPPTVRFNPPHPRSFQQTW